MFRGVIVALVTPFRGGEVDFGKLDELVEFHVGQGTDGIVPVGTTGESATLSHEEHDAVVARVAKAARGRIPVIAGAGSNSTAEAVRLTRHAKEAGADAVLHVVPYYNKPSQEGLFRHFEAVAGEGLPVILYNIPGRTGVDMTAPTVERLSRVRGIVGIKEATGSLDRISELKQLCPGLVVLSGDDSLTLPMLAVGAEGVISVVANLVPRDVKDMVARFARGDTDGARKRHLGLFPLTKALFLETNPVPVKTAMAMQGTISEEVRPPLAPLSEANRQALRKAMAAYGLL
jgi:4-hydroxy-tetrahydrodipicolinate synthase